MNLLNQLWLQKLLKQYEDTYDVKINLVNEQGLIQVDTDTGRIEKDYVDNSYFKNIGQNKLYIQEKSDSRCMTKYNKTLKWYLVIEDCNPNKINVVELTIPSIIIFVIGLMMMGIVFFIISERERKISKEHEDMDIEQLKELADKLMYEDKDEYYGRK